MTQKIVFINRFFYPDHSATSQLLTDLAFHLAVEGYRVSVISSHQSYDDSTELLPTDEICSGVRVFRIKTTNFGRNWLPGRVIDYASYFIGMAWRLGWHLKKGDIIIAKTDPPLTSVITVLIAKLKGAVHTNWVQDLFPEVAESIGFKRIPKFVLRALKALRNQSFRLSDGNVVIGEIMRQRLIDAGVKASSLRVIQNWSDGENVKAIPAMKNILRKAWQLENKFIVGYSGNLGRVHEFNTIIDAAKQLENRPEVVFIFIGGGAQKSYVQSLVDEAKLSNVLFFPYQPYSELSQSLCLPDVHLISLLPKVEGYCVPSKFYGVLAAGRPTLFIGAKAGELSLLVDKHHCGFQVDVGDDNALVENIVLLSNDEKEREKLEFNARAAFDQYYEKKIALKLWCKYISQLV